MGLTVMALLLSFCLDTRFVSYAGLGSSLLKKTSMHISAISAKSFSDGLSPNWSMMYGIPLKFFSSRCGKILGKSCNCFDTAAAGPPFVVLEVFVVCLGNRKAPVWPQRSRITNAHVFDIIFLQLQRQYSITLQSFFSLQVLWRACLVHQSM
jgi:hypothetical protein